MMVIIMSIMVVPFGVVAAVYLREYAKQGPMTQLIRIAVNNLAGVPRLFMGCLVWASLCIFWEVIWISCFSLRHYRPRLLALPV